MTQIGVTVSRTVQQPEPQTRRPRRSRLLGQRHCAPVAQIRRTHYSDEGRPVETADIVVPAVLCEVAYEVPAGVAE